jgi:thymidylate synthase
MCANEEESRYLTLVREIIADGDERLERTGVGTRALFARTLEFDLSDGSMPLLTTKRVFWRGVVEELLWFIRGSTSAKELANKNVHIWDANGTKEFLASRQLTDREEGDLGPIYGFQWRHWGATYVDMHTDYSGKGVDQLADCIHKIKTSPTDRRIIVSAWNVSDIPLMALPPCHLMCQFFVAKGQLSCLMYQRSADIGLGVPFNIASYSLLLHMIAHVCNLQPHRLTMIFGDVHAYSTHIDALTTQCERQPRQFPTLQIKRAVLSIDDFTSDDFELRNYDPHPSIAMPMAV